jgi:Tol biopolymer transport system component
VIGQTLGHYRIEAKLGEGGMGVVYLARDTHLDRLVAIKLLTPSALSDTERKRRFIQEAKAASSLSHPNIIHIYDISNCDGVEFMVMEYVQGRTLDKLIGDKGLKLPQVLDYGIQIASALAAAHLAGIVHRDLKPGNVMVTDNGLVKVLDFGLAKLMEPLEARDDVTTQTVPAHTETGIVLGTVAYMSPEQIEGKRLDGRSDIFSFGAVLYEMLTGQRAFHGSTRISTLSAILNGEPKPISAIVTLPGGEIERIVSRCLRKDSTRRFQHVDDLKLALLDLKEEHETGGLPGTGTGRVKSRRRRRILATTAGVLALALAAGGVAWWVRKQPPPPQLVLRRLTSEAGLADSPALSADGKFLAYSSESNNGPNRVIWVRHLGAGEAVQLTRGEADCYAPSFSPDGGMIAYRSDRDGGGIYVIPTLGGDERRIAPDGMRPRYSPDGKWISYWVGKDDGFGGRVFIIPAIGGEPVPIQPDFGAARWPLWSPDSKYLLFCGIREPNGPLESADWWVAPTAGGRALATGASVVFRKQHLLSLPQVRARQFMPSDWTADNYIYFAAGLEHSLGYNTNIFRIAVSPNNWQVNGRAQRLTFGSGQEYQPAVRPGGNLVFSTFDRKIDIWSLPINANTARGAGELKQVTRDGAFLNFAPSMSATGQRMVYHSYRSQNAHVWIRDFETGREKVLTMSPVAEVHPIISRNGQRVVFEYTGDPREIQMVSAAGGPTRRLCRDCGKPTDWSPDEKYILYQHESPRRVFLLDADSGARTELLTRAAHDLANASFSPDGRWVVFQETTGQRSQRIWAAPFRGVTVVPSAQWIPITEDNTMNYNPSWAPDGNLVYFISERDGFRCIYSQRLSPLTRQPEGVAATVRHFHTRRLSMMDVWDLLTLNLAVTRDQLVFNLSEVSSDIWMAKLE